MILTLRTALALPLVPLLFSLPLACARPAPAAAPSLQKAAAHDAPPAPAAQEASPKTDFALLELEGRKVGRIRSDERPLPGGGVEVRTLFEARFSRLGGAVTIRSDETDVEGADGVLRTAKLTTSTSKQELVRETTVEGLEAHVREGAGDDAIVRTVKLDAPPLGSKGIERLCTAKLHAPGDVIEYPTWSSEGTMERHVRRTVEARETITLDGATVTALRVKETSQEDPRGATLWLDERCDALRALAPTAFGALIATKTRTEPEAPAEDDAGQDVYVKTEIRSNVRLPRPRAMEKLVVHLTFDDAAATPEGLEGPGQRVLSWDEGRRGAVVEIDRGPSPAAASDAEAAKGLAGANAYIDANDPGVRAIAAAATAGAKTDAEKAERLTRWVEENMTPDAGIGFAGAKELARDHHGTCTGYAVLLAALLRAAGIPSRIDLGLAYVDGVFAGHAWTEASLDGRWVALDAALAVKGAADAARIAFERDGLDGGTGAMMASASRWMGHTKVAVREYAVAGADVRADEAAAPYTVQGSTYTNPGLGLTVTAPAGFVQFTHTDEVYPQPIVFLLQGGSGAAALAETSLPDAADPVAGAAKALGLEGPSACERRTALGRPACATTKNDTAIVAFADGPTLFVLSAKPARTLDAVLAAMRFSRTP